MGGVSGKVESERINALARLIASYQESYYNGDAEITDAEFDVLWDELRLLAPGHPLLRRVGADAVDGFAKARHLMPMGSQEKAADPEEFLAWAAKTAAASYIVEYKLDGASLELQYSEGKLVRAVTRGDGATGDDISANARRFGGVVAELDQRFSGGVRGEVLMPRAVWREKYADKANCRNAANGLMRRKDGEGAEDLQLVCYDVAAFAPSPAAPDASASNTAAAIPDFGDEATKLAWLAGRGFMVPPACEFTDPAGIVAYRDEVSRRRPKLPYDIDGLVVKDRQSDVEDLRRTRPERQIAFKFALESAVTTLRAVEWSESGATYTPIGVVDPVRLAGTTVQRANLANPDIIRALNLTIGARVVVVKRGEIIPKIEGLAPDSGSATSGASASILTPIEQPTVCGTCGAALVDAGTRLFCPNPACLKRLYHRLEKWLAVLEIREIGVKLLSRLFASGRLKGIADLFTLTAADLSELERMGELSAAKVLRNLRAERELHLARFVAGFDIEGVAETILDKVALAGFDTLAKLRAATADDLAAIHGLGDITARTIVDGLAETAADMDAVLAAGVVRIAPPMDAAAAPLRGCSFCFTGELAGLKRSAAEAQVKRFGAVAKSTVSRDLSFLVTNDPGSGSAKNRKAEQYGVRILDEAAFMALMADAGRGVAPPASPSGASDKASQGDLFTGGLP